ncbi:7TMR-DISM family protein [Dyadobacter fanqingshengii]|uniref:Chromosome partitioning protein ParA n=1 Tax=Dyadobacter fanqingshengii TaxID=2906443 RepID=A0A9X1PDR3_9BACT|nr:7TM diverse intracellular signaling domain-containing protein [Dyadobacter fanqingshengii]MCF0041382.1 chromosome partitioning protein ParA [Dyadobacter fanqingshengii]USJ36897.1 chromosome partitioning protein ParA [Dyadobacter fanqingshengii]
MTHIPNLSGFRYINTVFLAAMFFIGLVGPVYAQRAVEILDSQDQHIFTGNEIQYLEDKTGTYTINDVLSPALEGNFRNSATNTPQNYNLKSAYWFRIRIRHNPDSRKNWMLEFFDQTIDDITAYSPNGKGGYSSRSMGDQLPFKNREYSHKNFELNISNSDEYDGTYYFRVKSHQTADAIIVLRSVNRFIKYALDEYFIFGIFYGMVLVFSFYNLMMYLAVRQVQYLYYVLYNLCVGLFEMCIDGVAYQYLWPNAPEWNQYAYGVALFGVSIFALQFTRTLLYTHRKAPALDRFIVWVMVLRTAFFLICLIFNTDWFSYKFVELIPLAVAFYSGIHIYRQGYHPARFFVLGYTFLSIGFIHKLLLMLHVEGLNFGVVTYYSLSICFVLEMIFLSFAIGDKVRVLKTKKDKVQKQMIHQMRLNEKLKDSLNVRLEAQVEARTKEVVEKSAIIEAQNQELTEVNALLEQQKEEILQMNLLLEKDNEVLHTNVVKVTQARVMSTEVDFEEFSRIYPDTDSCFRFLASMKWTSSDHECRKCGHDHYFHGHSPYSRRCSKCDYDESVIAHTIFQNTRIPINKAFYMVFLIYTTKGKISSHKLSEILSIRQGTCWAYASRIKKVMHDRRKEIAASKSGEGWSLLVLDHSLEPA